MILTKDRRMIPYKRRLGDINREEENGTSLLFGND